jgi:hypothetical protein
MAMLTDFHRQQTPPSCKLSHLALLMGRGLMGISGRVLEWGFISMGTNGFRGQRVGAGRVFCFWGLGRVGTGYCGPGDIGFS